MTISLQIEKLIVGLCVLISCYLFYPLTFHTNHPAIYLSIIVTLTHLIAHEILVPILRKVSLNL